MEIKINDYRTYIGGNKANHTLLAPKIHEIIEKTLLDCEARLLDLYTENGSHHNHCSGRSGVDARVVIFLNGTFKGAPAENIVIAEAQPIFGIENTFTTFLSPLKSEKCTRILVENGLPVAEWNEDTYEFNILFDLFNNMDNVNAKLSIFAEIIKAFNEQVWIVKKRQFSWLLTNNKDKLIKTFSDSIAKSRESLIKNDIDRLSRLENDIRTYKTNLKTLYDQANQKRRIIETEQKYNGNIGKTISDDLNLMLSNKKIKDVFIKGNKATVYTYPLFIHNGSATYYGGNYRIEIDMHNSNIRFFGDNPRSSYWTDHDPHPHVNGNTGEACLGNISATIAELCSQFQLYPLSLMCIDFLESVNTSDAAGKHVVEWDLVDKEGKITKKKDLEYCSDCGYKHIALHTVYNGIEWDDDNNDNAHGTEKHQVCEECRDNYYYYNDEIEAYVANED